MAKKIILLILDGWGIAEPSGGNAISTAKTPALDNIEKNYFSTSLQASGMATGLPWGREGNSEVGHTNLGAGRIVYQYLPRITNAIRDGSFFKNKAFLGAVNFVKVNNSTLHLMGMVSSGTIHSYTDHLYALLELARQNNLQKVVLHIFTDGKDSSPKEGLADISNLQLRLQAQPEAKIGTIVGRVYGMDRNNNWQLTQKAYELITQGKGNTTEDPLQYIKNSYESGLTDFNIEPVVVQENGQPVGLVKKGDGLIFFNFREDSARQITKAFVAEDKDFQNFPRTKISNLYFVGMTDYQKGLPIEIAFPPPEIKMSLAETLSKAGKKQLHIAETEKYAHVTYFFNGEKDIKHAGEEHALIASRGAPYYEKEPNMQVYAITENLYENISLYDFFVINFANADILAHTGDFEAAVKGIEAIDTNISGILELAKSQKATLIITADHGNAESMRDMKTGTIITRHTPNPVPFYLASEEYKAPKPNPPLYIVEPSGVLADVAPTILKLMGIKIPPQMTGKPLV